jgi:hypothetical protein
MAVFSGNRVRLDVTLAIGMTANTVNNGRQNGVGSTQAGFRLVRRGDSQDKGT